MVTLRDAIAAALALPTEERSRLVMVLLETILAEQAPSAGRSVEWWQGEIERRRDDGDRGKWDAAVDEAAANVRAADRRRRW